MHVFFYVFFTTGLAHIVTLVFIYPSSLAHENNRKEETIGLTFLSAHVRCLKI